MTAVTAKILSSGDIEPAVTALHSGQVVGLPTETVYGLAGNAFNEAAVTRIFQAKERPSFDPLIVHVHSSLNSVSKLGESGIIDESQVTTGMSYIVDKLAKAFWPGPLTMILPKHQNIPYLVTSGLDRVGIRMPAHPVAQKILEAAGCPLAAPSANRFGRISPTTAAHVMEELGDRISYIIDGGSCDIGVESTVVAIDDERIWLLRPGKISAADLEAAAAVPVERAPSVHEKASPGMLESHYAPKKPMYLLRDWAVVPDFMRGKSFDLLVTSGNGNRELEALRQQNLAPGHVVHLSNSGDAAEAAHNLFSAMRSLDRTRSDLILATNLSSTAGLWLAIEDRLRRASSLV